ncbi:MAG: hypothetical protein QOF48_3508 [Verrucomicrobiota bacterium]|jgi:hypothetical protein
MATKRPFARVAGWAALWLSLGAAVLFLVPILTKPMQATMPAAFAMALVTLCALGVFFCVVLSVLCGVIALCGMRTHGRNGVLGPAAGGLTLAGLMLIPILAGMASGFAEHSRLVRARERPPVVGSSNQPARPSSTPIAPR